MKKNHLALILGLGLVASFAAMPSLQAVPLTGTTAVQTKPEAKAPAITYLKAGADPVAATSFTGMLPMGWMAVELPGPFQGYVTNNDISKNLDILPGASIRLEPKMDATVLTTMVKGDVATITGIPKGKWIQVELQKKIVGYINLTPASAAPMTSSATLPATTTAASLPPSAAAPVTTAGHAAPMTDLGDGGSAALPRQFEGKFVSTHRPLAPRRPYDFQLNDDSGARLAYIDVSKLLQTEQMDKYVGRTVVLFGTAKNDADAKGIVIRAESLLLK